MNPAVLLAEPEPSTREFLQRHLADDGFDVLGAEAEREALELLERLRPSLVLSSPELCRRLREGEPGPSWDRDVPVIVLRGNEADTVDRVRAFHRGCDDYVGRPFHYDELRGVISHRPRFEVAHFPGISLLPANAAYEL